MNLLKRRLTRRAFQLCSFQTPPRRKTTQSIVSCLPIIDGARTGSESQPVPYLSPDGMHILLHIVLGLPWLRTQGLAGADYADLFCSLAHPRNQDALYVFLEAV